MRAIMRVALAASVLSTGFALAGCEDTKLMSMFDGKKKLPGERKEVFPGGVPGIQQGVPPELMKGYQAPQDEKPVEQGAAPSAAPEQARVQQAAVAPSEPAAEKRGIMVGGAASGVPDAPKPKKKVARPKPKPVAAAPQDSQPYTPPPVQQAPQPAPAPQPQQSGASPTFSQPRAWPGDR